MSSTTKTETSNILNKVENMEKELRLLKMEAFWYFRTKTERDEILKKTFGILGKSFVSGVEYENNIRKGWNKKFKPLNI